MRCATLVLLAAGAIAAAQSPEDSVRYRKLCAEGESAFRSGDMAKAAQSLGEAVKIYGRDGDVVWHYGQALLNQKRYPEAIESLTLAGRLGGFGNKFASVIAYDLGCAHAQSGAPDLAFKQLERAMALGFRDLDHLRSDTDLEPLRKDPRWAKLARLNDVAKMSRDDAWRYDLELMDYEARRKHYAPYTVHTKDEFDSYVAKLRRDIPKLTDNQVRAAFVRYMAMFGDGHTGIRPAQGSVEGQHVPLQLFWFKEGVFVTLAGPGSEDLAGAQILEVGGKPISEVLEIARPYTSHENEQGYRAGAVGWLLRPGWLNAMGLAKTDAEVTYRVKDATGAARDVTLKKGPATPSPDWTNARNASGNPEPLYLKNRTTAFWFEILPDRKLLYFQYNAVSNMPNETTAQFAARLSKALEGDIETLVVDVRWNGGGNSFLNRPLTHAILKCKQNREGSLFVITGRNTYSACQNFSTDLGRETEALFVGEPTGSSPNFIGETVRTTLPYSRMTMSVSDLYWQRSWPMDSRTWIAPDLPAEPSFAVFKVNRDPAMEAIEAFLNARSNADGVSPKSWTTVTGTLSIMSNSDDGCHALPARQDPSQDPS